MTTSEEFGTVEEAYQVAIGNGSLKVKASEVLAFLGCLGMVLSPFWVEHAAMWYWSL